MAEVPPTSSSACDVCGAPTDGSRLCTDRCRTAAEAEIVDADQRVERLAGLGFDPEHTMVLGIVRRRDALQRALRDGGDAARRTPRGTV